MSGSSSLLIDVSAAVNQRAGIGRYAREITRHLLPMLECSTTRLWYAADPGQFDAHLLSEEPWNAMSVSTSLLPRRLVDRTVIRHRIPFGRLIRTGRVTTVYSPDFTAPPAGGATAHITVHDLAWLHPEAATPAPLARFLGPVVERSIGQAATVFTVSEAIRSEVIDRYRVSPESVVVAPNAAAEHFFSSGQQAAGMTASVEPIQQFVLYVGTIEPRKNLETLFSALEGLPEDIRLVIAGRRGFRADEILGKIRRLDLESRVIELGFVQDAKLPALMARSLAVVYPSSYEGFGLPVVEALATGSPVACSDLPVFREVAGPVARYFEPEEPDSIAEGIEAAISDGRDDPAVVEARIARARTFDWSTTASIVRERLIGTDR